MIILGISLGFNSAASLWQDGKCLVSISQERLTGVRNTKELPLRAAKTCFEIASIKGEDIIVAYTHYEKLSHEYLDENLPKEIQEDKYKYVGLDPEPFLRAVIEDYTGCKVIHCERIEHHSAHMYSAYAVYGKSNKKHTVLTMDGFGDGVSARLTIGGKNIAELDLVHSPALYYQFVTGALGFKEHQHEGKITGLATGGYIDCNDKRIDEARDFFTDVYNRPETLSELNESEEQLVAASNIIDFEWFLRLRKTIYRYIKDKLGYDYRVEDILLCPEAIAIAVAVQRFAEEIVSNFLFENRTELTEEIYLAGGMFANVAINRLFGDEYNNVYISPAMGDEGGAMGAAALLMEKKWWTMNGMLTDEFHPEYIIAGGLDIGGGTHSCVSIAKDLADDRYDQIVHLCSGRSEFGPRALMHRSSLFPATLSRHSEQLNRAMHRSEFMPYAPVCKSEDCDMLFENWQPFEKSLHFMTVALITKPGVAEKYPAGVHKDGTCRVQVVHKDVDCERQAWDILDAYQDEAKNGERILINTSFNMHNEPTCCTVEQCNSAWERSGGLGTLYFKKEEFVND